MTLGQRRTSGLGQYFEARRFTTGVTADFPVSERGRFSLTTSYNDYKMGSPSRFSSDQIIRESLRGQQTTGEFGYTYSFDTRRAGFGESADYLFRIGQELGVRNNSLGFIRTTGFAAAKTSIFDDTITLSAEFEAGNLSMLSDRSRYEDRFFLS